MWRCLADRFGVHLSYFPLLQKGSTLLHNYVHVWGAICSRALSGRTVLTYHSDILSVTCGTRGTLLVCWYFSRKNGSTVFFWNTLEHLEDSQLLSHCCDNDGRRRRRITQHRHYRSLRDVETRGWAPGTGARDHPAASRPILFHTSGLPGSVTVVHIHLVACRWCFTDLRILWFGCDCCGYLSAQRHGAVALYSATSDTPSRECSAFCAISFTAHLS
jgi:hypothetical protein